MAGTWCLMFYLLAALTGLTWSYEWYNKGLTRLLSDSPQNERVRSGRGPAPSGPAPTADYAAIWSSIYSAAGPGLSSYNVRMPPVAGQPATVFYLLKNSPHDMARNQLTLDPATGIVSRHDRYSDKSLKAQLLTSVYALHVGSYFGIIGRIIVTIAALAMPLFFFITGWLLYLDRRRKKRQIKDARKGLAQPGSDAPAWLIGFASQSGFAEQLAWQTAGQLQAAGLPVKVQPLANVSEQDLQDSSNALFVVSTFGDGEAPDSARGFERKVLGRALSFDSLNYAVLGLGDRQYQHFCGFARRLHTWLGEHGGKTLFAPVEVDSGDPYALRHWQQQLGLLTGQAPVDTWQAPSYDNWTLTRRELMNPDSSGSPVYLLGLSAPPPPAAGWPVIWWKYCRAIARGPSSISSTAWGSTVGPRLSSMACRKRWSKPWPAANCPRAAPIWSACTRKRWRTPWCRWPCANTPSPRSPPTACWN